MSIHSVSTVKFPFTRRYVIYAATEPVNVLGEFTVTPLRTPTPGKQIAASGKPPFSLIFRVGCDSLIRHVPVTNHFVANASIVQKCSRHFCPTITTSRRSRRLDPKNEGKWRRFKPDPTPSLPLSIITCARYRFRFFSKTKGNIIPRTCSHALVPGLNRPSFSPSVRVTWSGTT